MPTLFIASGPKEGQWFPIKGKSLIVGRDEALIGQVVAEGVSRKHLQIRFDPESKTYWAADMGSKNGVVVNNVKISSEVQLKGDELIRIGEALLLYSSQDFDGADNALKFYRERGQGQIETLLVKDVKANPGSKA